MCFNLKYRDVYSRKVSDAGSDQKALFTLSQIMMNKNRDMSLPTNKNKDEIADKFAEFFTDKVAKIQSDLDKKTTSIRNEDFHTTIKIKENILNKFQPASVDEGKKIIPSKSCSLDTINLLKQCVDILSPIITDIVSMSITSGFIPSSMKEAIVTPLLKKTSLDPDQLKNYRPVSSLSFISKVIEKIVAAKPIICSHTTCMRQNNQL